MPQQALFLDRDGIINVDKHYVSDPTDFEWMPGIFTLAAAAHDLGALLIVVTNQSGIARGLYTEEKYQTLTAWMRARFEREGVPLAHVYHCPYLKGGDGEDHPLRKPNPGMLLAAQQDFDLDMSRCAMLGDKWTDMDAARAAGVGHAAIVGDARLQANEATLRPEVALLNDLSAATRWLAKTLGTAP